MGIFRIASVSVLGAVVLVCAPRSIDAAPFAYIANGGFGTVSVIDVETNAVVATISLPAGSSPQHVAVNPNGTSVYVSGGNALTVIDTATNSVVVPTIPIGLGSRNIATSPDGRFVYVAIQFEGSVAVVDTTTNSVVASVVTGGQPTGLKVTPDGSRVYVGDSLHGSVSVIDTSSNTVMGQPILVQGNPQDLEMSRDGAKVYVSNFNSASVSVIDTATNTVQATIAVGLFPYGMDTTPDGRTVYVVDNGSVAVIDTETNTLAARVTLPAFHTPRDVAVSPDGARGYVTINTPQRVLVFDTATNVLVGDPILIDDGIPGGIAITPELGAGSIPFASITAELNVRPQSQYELSAAGTFVLNHASDGIQPVSELVRLTVSNVQGALFDATLSAGSLKAIAATGGIFHSQPGGAIRMLRITGGRVSGVYRFQLLAEAPRLNGAIDLPITLSLQIGNDAGSTTMSCGLNHTIKCR